MKLSPTLTELALGIIVRERSATGATGVVTLAETFGGRGIGLIKSDRGGVGE